MEDKKNYLYVINYPVYEKDLCMLEMRVLFGREPDEKVFISERRFDPSNSPFIKKRLEIIYEKETFEEILEEIEEKKIKQEGFKAEYLRLETGNIPYNDRLQCIREIGLRVVGFPNMTDPTLMLGVTKYKDKWLFGISVTNDYRWKAHDNKPCTYSNSLGIRVAKSVVNLANSGYKERKVIDACCGVATTLLEGLFAGYDIEGTELSPKTTANAKENLRFFGYPEKVKNMNMNDIDDNYEGCIIDIPYGLFSHTTKELQQEMMDTAKRISKRLVLVSFEDIDELVLNAGFKIVDRCKVTKGNFTRYILVCE